MTLTKTDIAPASNVGFISPNSVTFTAGLGTLFSLFTGSSAGSATLAAVVPAAPAGFSTPTQFASLTATVQQARLFTCGDGTPVGGQTPPQIGIMLEYACTVS